MKIREAGWGFESTPAPRFIEAFIASLPFTGIEDGRRQHVERPLLQIHWVRGGLFPVGQEGEHVDLGPSSGFSLVRAGLRVPRPRPRAGPRAGCCPPGRMRSTARRRSGRSSEEARRDGSALLQNAAAERSDVNPESVYQCLQPVPEVLRAEGAFLSAAAEASIQPNPSRNCSGRFMVSENPRIPRSRWAYSSVSSSPSRNVPPRWERKSSRGT